LFIVNTYSIGDFVGALDFFTQQLDDQLLELRGDASIGRIL